MTPLRTTELRVLLAGKYPLNAKMWTTAMDDLPAVVDYARALAGYSPEQGVRFDVLGKISPAAWNRLGVDGAVAFYDQLSENQRAAFCMKFRNWLSMGVT